ncbi:MAG: outer membrane protein OmpA-like peptidoglycan-associated protein [Maribacter sp.]|jgi:outer membrane protein OmpA-like peptidoglycan-associated protein
MRFIYAFFFLFMLQSSTAQNLIPNPGFEDVNICEVFKEQCSPRAWRNVLLKGFRFPELAMLERSSRGVRPMKGYRAAILPLFHKTRKNDRIYIQVPFLCTLEKGKEYEFYFHYLLTEEATQNFGVIFSDSLFIRENINDLIGVKPDIEINLLEKPKYNEWTQFKVNYTAKGGEQGIVIGNYIKDEDIEFKTLVKLKKKIYYPKRMMIWLDEFSFSPVDSLENICDLKYNKKEIYYDSIRHYVKDLTMPRNINNPSVLLEEEEIITDDVVESNDENNTEHTHDYGDDHGHNHEIIEEEKIPLEEEIIIAKNNMLDTLVKEKKIIEKIVINEPFTLDGIYFETNSARLLPNSYPALDELVEYLKENKTQQLNITGHTDSIGSEKDNLNLSKKRAASVAAYLIRKGVLLSRVSSSGKGEAEPIEDNMYNEGRAKNRRVEFLLEIKN